MEASLTKLAAIAAWIRGGVPNHTPHEPTQYFRAQVELHALRFHPALGHLSRQAAALAEDIGKRAEGSEAIEFELLPYWQEIASRFSDLLDCVSAGDVVEAARILPDCLQLLDPPVEPRH